MNKSSLRTVDKRALLAICVLILITFSYLARIGYTTSDDLQIAQMSIMGALDHAINAGRLTWFLAAPTNIASEVMGDIWYRKILRILWALALFHSCYLLLRTMLERIPAIFVLLFPVIFFMNDLDHHAFSSYPGLVVYGFACFFYSIYLFSKYLESKKFKYQLFSIILFSASLVTELFPSLIIFFLIFPKDIFTKRLKALKVHILILILIFISYLVFKGDTKGNHHLVFGMPAFNTWIIYSYSQIYNIKWNIISNIINFGFVRILLYFISISIILYISYLNFFRNSNKNNFVKWLFIFWWVSLSAWVNVPVALVDIYQGWVSRGSQAYLYSAISNLTVSIGIGLISLNISIRYKHKLVFLILATLMVFIYSSNAIFSYRAYHQQRYSHERWVLIDRLAKEKFFEDSKCYYAPWLFELNGITGTRSNDYWNSYLMNIWGIKTNIINSKEVCENYIVLQDPRSKPM